MAGEIISWGGKPVRPRLEYLLHRSRSHINVHVITELRLGSARAEIAGLRVASSKADINDRPKINVRILYESAVCAVCHGTGRPQQISACWSELGKV